MCSSDLLIQILNLVGHAKGALWALTRTAGIFHQSAKVRINGRTCAYPHNCVSLILRCSFIFCDAVGLVVRWRWALIFLYGQTIFQMRNGGTTPSSICAVSVSTTRDFGAGLAKKHRTGPDGIVSSLIFSPLRRYTDTSHRKTCRTNPPYIWYHHPLLQFCRYDAAGL